MFFWKNKITLYSVRASWTSPPCLIYATDKQNQLIYTNRKPKDRTAPSLDFVLSHFHPETESSSLLSFGDGLWHLYCENLLLNSRRNVTVYYLNRTQFSRPAEKIPLSVIRELPSDVAGKFYSDSNPDLNMHSKVQTYARSRHSVLLSGENGVGKETVAYYIHSSRQSSGKSVPA